jgi:cysteinyl-tRNA synthetase
MAMALFLFNTLSGKKEAFKPLHDSSVKFFVCGQTVYDDAHIGHAKAYIDFDVIIRWLRNSGYSVKYVQNITDVDDKIIIRAKETGIQPMELARHYEKRFMEDMEAIGVKQGVDEYPRSHDFIEEIRQQIQLLLDKGYAYIIEGDVYFDVKKFKDYTKLSHMKIEELEKHRIEPKEGKKNVYDFALWKMAKEGEPSWKISVKSNGKAVELNGRPGWHIEDTAMTWKIFGEQYDIHGGARELVFPHHSNEIAQAEAAFGKKPFVKYWLHCGVLTVDGVKMSKSLKNFITIRDVLKMYDAEVLRLLILSTHYRKAVDYTEELAKAANKKLNAMYEALSSFYSMKVSATAQEGDRDLLLKSKQYIEEFADSMDNDFNTPLALSKLTAFLGYMRAFAESNGSVGSKARDAAFDAVDRTANRVLGILMKEEYKRGASHDVESLIAQREAARKTKDFKKADEIRKTLKERYNVILEDTDTGVKWHRA